VHFSIFGGCCLLLPFIAVAQWHAQLADSEVFHVDKHVGEAPNCGWFGSVRFIWPGTKKLARMKVMRARRPRSIWSKHCSCFQNVAVQLGKPHE
jgi:hypothetical protein